MGRVRGHYVTKTWTGNPGAQTTAERRGAKYRAFVPEPIAGLDLLLTGEVAGALETASATVRELNASPPKLVSLEAVARYLLRERRWPRRASRVLRWDIDGSLWPTMTWPRPMTTKPRISSGIFARWQRRSRS